MKQRLIIGLAAAQCVEADTPMGKADLATHQSMRPVFADRVGPAEKVDGTVLIASTDEDDQPFQRRVRIECETLWKRASRVSAVTAARGFVSVCGRCRSPIRAPARRYGGSDDAARPCSATGH